MTILIPNLFTALNFLTGCASIFSAWAHHFEMACLLLYFSMAFDCLDGALARKLGKESRFGSFFDSLSDFVSFGIAPAVIFLKDRVASNSLAIAVAAFYIFCSIFRLFRFHAKKRTGTTASGNSFEGLPITASALILISFFLISRVFSVMNPYHFLLMTILSGLMVSRISFYKPSAFWKQGVGWLLSRSGER